MDAVRLRERLEGVDLVVTGEGAFDAQSLHGKVPAGVLRAAAEAGVPAIVLAGRADAEPEPTTPARVYSLADRFGLDQAMARAEPLLEDLAAEVAGSVLAERA